MGDLIKNGKSFCEEMFVYQKFPTGGKVRELRKQPIR